MERKVGLIPLVYDEYNYGGVLQFYALQATIVRLGYSGEIIRCEIGDQFVHIKLITEIS